MTVADFIRSVPNLSDAELRAALTCPDFGDGDATAHAGMANAALDELLRRQRHRCADVCRDWAADMRATWDPFDNSWAHQEARGAEECEHRIREL